METPIPITRGQLAGTGGNRVVSVRLSDADHAALRLVAAAQDQSMSSFVEEVVRERLRDDLGGIEAHIASLSKELHRKERAR